MEAELALLITVVLAADADQSARAACEPLVRRIDGRIVQSGDCSDEEPGCWSVSISRLTGSHAARTDTRALADAVRGFVHRLGPGFAGQRVACDPPAAWTVVDDPELVGRLVPGGERMLVEAWVGADEFFAGHAPAAPSAAHHAAQAAAAPAADPHPQIAPERAAPEPVTATTAPITPVSPSARSRGVVAGDLATPPEEVTPDTLPHVQLWVDVLTDRTAGAEWQARAVASRVTRAATITEVIDHRDGLVTVGLDLGPATTSPAQAVLDAMSGIGRPGWTPLEWEGESAVTRWVAEPRPSAGIAALELTTGPPAELAEA